MFNKTTIQVENISKQYRIGEIGMGTVSDDLKRWWWKIRGKEDPFLRVGDTNDRTKKRDSDFVWALRDINFTVQQGEILGIIGKNGAGKSTLLKILSRITSPTQGKVKSRGRIASLLEVGTGFHPELTGRENIFLNGTILGMTKVEVSKKLDAIVDFAGVAKYLDTPIRRYSSGMKVRLGFSVAAFLEPEILIIDEVLAVGDAGFQKEAIQKIKEISSEEGRTILFVSHNLGSIRKLCQNGILLTNGKIDCYGKTDKVLSRYLSAETSVKGYFSKEPMPHLPSYCAYAKTINEAGEARTLFTSDQQIILEIKLIINRLVPEERLIVIIQDTDNQPVMMVPDIQFGKYIQSGEEVKTFRIAIPANTFTKRMYTTELLIYNPGAYTNEHIQQACAFNVDDLSSELWENGLANNPMRGYLIPKYNVWTI